MDLIHRKLQVLLSANTKIYTKWGHKKSCNTFYVWLIYKYTHIRMPVWMYEQYNQLKWNSTALVHWSSTDIVEMAIIFTHSLIWNQYGHCSHIECVQYTHTHTDTFINIRIQTRREQNVRMKNCIVIVIVRTKNHNHK